MKRKIKVPRTGQLFTFANGGGFLGAIITQSLWGAAIGCLIGIVYSFYLASKERTKKNVVWVVFGQDETGCRIHSVYKKKKML